MGIGYTRNSRCENAKNSVQDLEKGNMKRSIVGEKRTRQLEYCISFNLLRSETFLLELLEQRKMESIVRIIHLLSEKSRFRALCFFIKLSLTLVWFLVLLYKTTEFRYCHLVLKKFSTSVNLESTICFCFHFIHTTNENSFGSVL